MKVCVERWTALSAYVDGALPPDERERLEAHLQQCAACRENVVHLQSLRRAISLLPQQEPPPMLKARILSATVDKPTWSERLAMSWRQITWRASLAAAAVLMAFMVWHFAARQMPPMMNTFVLNTTKSRASSVAAQRTVNRSREKPTASVSVNKPPRIAQDSAAQRTPNPVRRPIVAKNEVQWSTVTRAHMAPASAPSDALQGEPVIEEDVPHIDVNSPPAGTGELMAKELDETEGSKTVATRFTLPAEVVPSQTQGLESLREQIRIRGAEQFKGQIERKIERKQVELDVIKVRF